MNIVIIWGAQSLPEPRRHVILLYVSCIRYLDHIIDTTFSSGEKFELFDRYTTLQSLYTALGHQLQDGLMGQQEFDRTRFIVRKLWDLKLQIDMIEKEGTQPPDVIGHATTLMLHSEGILTRSLFVYVCTHLYDVATDS